MFYLTAFPDELYFHWQVKVQHYNFIVEQNIKPENIVCLIGYRKTPNLEFQEYLNKIGIVYYYYNIDDLDLEYSPRIRPFLFRNFYENNKEYVNRHVFIHDTDITLTFKPKFKGFTNKNWYLSDCNSYLNYNYLKGFGKTLFKQMCDIVQIDSKIVIMNNFDSGGAQYYGCDLDHNFWKKVEVDTVNLFYLLRIQSQVNKDEYFKINGIELTENNKIQVWTAGMWADLWNLFLNKNVIVEKELEFSWANSNSITYFQRPLFHNAGVGMNDTVHFSKLNYRIETPFDKQFHYSAQIASFHYCKKIKLTNEWLKTL